MYLAFIVIVICFIFFDSDKLRVCISTEVQTPLVLLIFNY